MRIRIDIDGAGNVPTTDSSASYPPSTSPPTSATGAAPAAVDEASAAEVARITGATNAGAAPTGPDAPYGGLEPSWAATAAGTGWTGNAESAGSAPTHTG